MIEKIYAGEKLSEKELRFLVTGYNPCCDAELGSCKIIKEVTRNFSRDTVGKQTIIQIGNDFWGVDWEKGLTEMDKDKFHTQPYRVEKKEKTFAIDYYERTKKTSNINPDHYKTRKFECIDEMLLVFGKEAVLNFCLLNAWKYRYRAGSKGNAEEDLKKADEYMRFVYWLKGTPDLLKLNPRGSEVKWGYDDFTTKHSKNEKIIISNNENIKYLIESKTKEQNLLLCAEEAGEWIQTVSKMARGTPEERQYKRRRDKLIGETADLIICIDIIRQMYGIDDDELQEMIDYKMQRNLERIKG